MESEQGGSSSKCKEEATIETSPDMLKNTPSNIRRLANEIEQCEGRHKYLAQTTSPSDGGDVRWYFCKVHLTENELAAAVPRTEIVGKSDYFRFGMRDSLAIEASFLQREEELLSAWWKEYAECSEGPGRRRGSTSKSAPQLKSTSVDSARSSHLYAIDEERVGVPVKGGLYEVDLVKRHCFPVYWNGDNRRALRGHWFARKGGLDWLPVREDVSEQLEFAYRSMVWRRRTFQPSGLFAARVDLQGPSLGLHALFTGEDDTWEAWLKVDGSGFSGVISFGRNGIKLRRGYAPPNSAKPTQDELRQQKEEKMDDYCSQVPVRHLVFMVHGIGQRLEKSNLVDDVATFRHITASLAERHLTSYQRSTQRVLFIPCQWRRDLKLSGETAVEKITLDGVRGLRVMLSATVHDVLYYMSPIYCQDIIDSVSNQLNRLYMKFLKRNPGYDGKVSLYGHSLGSVLSYDILCHQENLSSPFPMDWMYNEHDKIENSPPKITNPSSIIDDESEEMVGPTDHDNACAESRSSVTSEEHVEDSCNSMGPSVSSDSDEHSIAIIDSLEPKVNSSFDDDIQPVVDRSDSNEIVEEVLHSEKYSIVKSLGEEISFLHERIEELESPADAEGNKHEASTVTNQPVYETLPSGKINTGKSFTPYINYTKLKFKVDTFFAVGSPLGVFLALRNVRIGIGKGQEYWEDENINEEMPACRQMLNIFHPFDPVAYRVEPLISKDYINKRPVIIPYHRGGKRLHIGLQEFTEGFSVRSQAIIDRISFVKVKLLSVCEARKDDDNLDASENAQEKEERLYGSVMMERLTGDEQGRVDYVLQDKTFQHQYISAIGAHTNYWRDNDTALFILNHLYRDTPEEPSDDEANVEDWFDDYDEELPLTFADKVAMRNFCRKANKFIKKQR